MTGKQAIHKGAAQVLVRDAETLLQHVAGRDRAWLLAHPEAELSPEQETQFFGLIARRAAGEPLQYLTGVQEFFGLPLVVTPAVLIPRPETELLVEAVLGWLESGGQGQGQGSGSGSPRIVDVGTGSGAIALALASALPDAEIWAVDLSDGALAVAQQNAERLGLQAAVQFRRSDLLDVFLGETEAEGRGMDVVVSNPPYVPLSDAPSMQAEVRDFEPHSALFASEDGLAVYRRLIPEAEAVLRPGGLLAMEFGFGQREALRGLLQGWNDVRFADDYAGIPRMVLAVKP